MPKKSAGEVEKLYREFLSVLPDFLTCLNVVPDGQLRIFGLLAMRFAAQVCEDRGEAIDPSTTEDLLSTLQGLLAENDLHGLSELFSYSFRLFTETMIRTYLGTQFFYWRNFDQVRVDPLRLYEAVTSTQIGGDVRLENYFPNDLQLLIDNLRENINRMYVSNQPCLEPPLTYEEMETHVLLAAAFGSTTWQKAEAMWAGRSLEYREPVRVFLSYARKDRRKITPFKRQFEKAGYKVWIDEKDIAVGSPILDSISRAISEDIDFTVIFLSKNSVDSEWVKFETRVAHDHEIKLGQPYLLPVLLTECNIPSHLRIKKYADARGRPLRCADELIDSISAHLLQRPLC